MITTNIKINLGFSADEALMYLIQQNTKLPTEEILGFFYDLGTKVAEIGVANMEGTRSIRKDIRDAFPGSNVPFKLLVKAYKRSRYVNGSWALTDEVSGQIVVEFPDKSRSVDHKALIDKILERTLLDGESLPNFPQPKNKTPKMYKDLIGEVITNRVKSTNE